MIVITTTTFRFEVAPRSVQQVDPRVDMIIFSVTEEPDMPVRYRLELITPDGEDHKPDDEVLDRILYAMGQEDAGLSAHITNFKTSPFFAGGIY